MSEVLKLKLNTGAHIPAVGLGTWKSEPGEVTKAVQYALQDGYRHVDAALIYGNENEVGQGIRQSGVPREDIFITGKLWNTDHPDAKKGLQKTLDALGTDYLDLYPSGLEQARQRHETIANGYSRSSFTGQSDSSRQLLPVNPDGSRSVDRSWDQADTWRQMEELYKSGAVKAIGVANWSVPYLEELRKTWEIVPAVNQVELHPYLPQHALKEFCDKQGILLEAYSPLGSTGAPIMSDPDIQHMAEKYGVGPANILISYHACRGVVALPKSVSEQRISSNRKLVSLSKEDVSTLDSLAAKGKAKRINTPAWGFDLGFEDWYGPVA